MPCWVEHNIQEHTPVNVSERSSPVVRFSLAEIQAIAENILKAKPDPIPAYRLLREVLRQPPEDNELRRATVAVEQSKWVQQLERAQLLDGSWGRFHSQDTKVKTTFRTSEEALDRAFSLGLDVSYPVLTRAADFIEKVLTGRAAITDRAEKNTAWPLVIRFMLAGRLAALQGSWPQSQPVHPIIDSAWECLAEVTRLAFASGQYRLADEADAFVKLANTHVPVGFIESQHALWILSARPLPDPLERPLLEWVWNKPDGIRYLRVSLCRVQPRQFAYWLRSMNIFTRFSSWRPISGDLLNTLWDQRDEPGFWDFGRQPAQCIDFPLSENWRSSIKRKVDYTTCMLVIMRRWFDTTTDPSPIPRLLGKG